MMEGLPRTAVGPDPDKIFRTIPQPGVLKRLVRALADTAGELSAGASSYFGVALLPDRLEEWFPLKLSKLIGASLAHPVATIEGAFASDDTRFTRRKWFVPVLAASAAIHGVAIIYLIYLAFFSPYANIRVVNKAFPKFDRNALDEKLYYPPQVLLLARGPAMTLEEIRARAEKRKEELARAKEKAEKERKNKEEAERKAAEDAAKAAAEKKPVPTEFGEINEAPIKATVETLYQLFQAGGLDIPEMKFSVMAGFKVETDGSLSNIHIIQPSKSPIINEKAKEILHNISYSHALGPVSDLSSATISLDVTEDLARLRIMAFATTPETAKAKADLLKVLFWALRMKQKSPDVAELLSLIKVRSEGKRVDTDLIVPREKAAEMFRAWVAHPSTPPQ
ncbi:MAG TPA: hypothetical protein VGL29_05950 [Blastocatellia bacterium]|jgi:hypothetical protein